MSETDTDETIAAIATAPGRGGVAVIRIAGRDAFKVASRLTGRTIDATLAGRFCYAKLRNAQGVQLDEALVLVFAAPHSYTGEDAVELQTHGGTFTPQLVLQAVLAAGARLARRGEFTLRAFLHGKLDLTQAEAVIDLVDAKSERAQHEAELRLSGAQSATFTALYDDAVALGAKVEHALDFSEDELPEDFMTQVAQGVQELLTRVRLALATAQEGKLLHQGARVVLVGEPNVGKSSLMNALLGEERAIVSNQAGTTRDTIEAWVQWEGWAVCLVDTAGLRDTQDVVEREGVKRSKATMRSADLILSLSSSQAVAEPMRDVRWLDVRTKEDLTHEAPVPPTLGVSAVTGEGLQELKHAIVKRLEYLAAHSDEAAASVTERQAELLQRAERELAAVHVEEDCVLAANSLRRAAEALGALVGRGYGEDLLDALFSRFCVGK